MDQRLLVVFDLLGATLGLCRRAAMARDMGLDEERLRPGGSTLTINVRSAGDVQPVLDVVRDAGGDVLRAAHEVLCGGTTGFTPAGYLWELAHNPFAPPGDPFAPPGDPFAPLGDPFAPLGDPFAPLGDDGRFRWRGFGDDQ